MSILMYREHSAKYEAIEYNPDIEIRDIIHGGNYVNLTFNEIIALKDVCREFKDLSLGATYDIVVDLQSARQYLKHPALSQKYPPGKDVDILRHIHRRGLQDVEYYPDYAKWDLSRPLFEDVDYLVKEPGREKYYLLRLEKQVASKPRFAYFIEEQ